VLFDVAGKLFHVLGLGGDFGAIKLISRTGLPGIARSTAIPAPGRIPAMTLGT
jgi:hypothetical protein